MADRWSDTATAELVSNLPDYNGRVFRIRAPDGWIIVGSSLCNGDRGIATSMAMTFVPDEAHRWLTEGDANE